MKFVESFIARFSGYPASLQATLNSFVPHKTDFPLIKLGGEGDGAYLVPNDLEDIDGAISLGCGKNIQFEEDLYNQTGINSVIVDASKSFPANFKDTSHTFLDGWIGEFAPPINQELPIYNLSSVLEKAGKERILNGLLKIDIEASEYSFLLGTNLDTLRQFRIIIVEFHRLNELKTSSIFCRIVDEILRKFEKEFVVCHFHPNNAVKFFQVGKTHFPSCVEVTFLRKNRSLKHDVSFGDYPKAFDIQNDAGRPVIPVTFPIRIV
jgi:hypothetical protein